MIKDVDRSASQDTRCNEALKISNDNEIIKHEND